MVEADISKRNLHSVKFKQEDSFQETKSLAIERLFIEVEKKEKEKT